MVRFYGDAEKHNGQIYEHNVSNPSVDNIKELKKLLLQWQRECPKTIGFNEKKGPYTCIINLVHFFTILGQTTMQNDEIQGFLENART